MSIIVNKMSRVGNVGYEHVTIFSTTPLVRCAEVLEIINAVPLFDNTH